MAATSESCCVMRNGVGEEIPHLSDNKEKKHAFSQQPMKQRKLKMAATSESCCIMTNGVGEEIPHLSNNKEKAYVFSTTHETEEAENGSNL